VNAKPPEQPLKMRRWYFATGLEDREIKHFTSGLVAPCCAKGPKKEP